MTALTTEQVNVITTAMNCIQSIAPQILSSEINSERMKVHINRIDWIQMFDEFEIKTRNNSDYPYEFSKVVNGVKFFALATEQEYLEASNKLT